jgi:CO dehydrogenase/acetyl-CoA synthase gamma subunit (corrinoid Fe-S protein)
LPLLLLLYDGIDVFDDIGKTYSEAIVALALRMRLPDAMLLDDVPQFDLLPMALLVILNSNQFYYFNGFT